MSIRGTKRASKVRHEEQPGTSKRRRTEPEDPLWQLRPVTDLKMSSIYNRSASEAPAELFRKDLISAMKLPDSEPLGSSEYWVITDTWKQDWERGVQVPVNPDSLPAPKVKIIPNPLPDNFQEFKLPEDRYIHLNRDAQYSPSRHQLSTTCARAEAACSYDLDACDVAWLELMNAERARAGAVAVTQDQLERVVEELEVRCWDKIQQIMSSEESLGIEYDENVICDVCRSPDSEDGNEMVFCDSCNICVHQACYGITVIPPGQWLCRPCGDGVRPTCALCPNLGGAMKCTLYGNKWAHVSCVLWIPEVSIGCAEKMEPITKISAIPTSRWSLVCVLCRERKGACIQCSVKTCKTAYHVTCAFKHGLEMRAIIEDENADDGVKLRSYCQKHSVNSKKDKCPGSGSEEEEVKRKRRKDMTSEEKNQARAARLHEIERDFDRHVNVKDLSAHLLDVDQEAIYYIYNYWKMKRRSGNNRPLLPPKSDDSELLTHRQEQADLDKMKMFVQLRQDLERVRNLCYMVSRREKLSRSFFRMREQTFHKQVAVLSGAGAGADVSPPDLAAVVEANHGPSIYDRLYSHANAKDHKNDFEELLARIAGPAGAAADAAAAAADSTPDDKRDLNGLPRAAANPYKKYYANGGTRRSGSMYSGLSSEESASEPPRAAAGKYRARALPASSTDDDRRKPHAAGPPSPKKKVSPKAKGKSTPRKLAKKRAPQSKTIIDTSSEDENIKSRMKKDRSRSKTLQQMEKEMGMQSASDSEELVAIRSAKNNKFPVDIYSDSSENGNIKTEGNNSDKSPNTMSDSLQPLPRTKGAMKQFIPTQPEPKTEKTVTKEVKKRGRKPSNSKDKKPIVYSDDESATRNKENIKYSKTKEHPSDLIVPQRQAAKKASENMRSAGTGKLKEELSGDRTSGDEKPDRTAKHTNKTVVKGKKERKDSKEKEEPLPPREKESSKRKMSSDIDKDTIAYVPQRQAAKKAAVGIKSGLGSKLPVVEVDDKKKDSDKLEAAKKSPKKEDEKRVKSPQKSSSSSSSNSSSSSYSSSSSSDEDDDDDKKRDDAKSAAAAAPAASAAVVAPAAASKMKPSSVARPPSLFSPTGTRPTVDLPFLDRVSRPLSSTSASSESDSSKGSRFSGSISPGPRRPRRRRKGKSDSTDTSPRKAPDKKLKTSERRSERGAGGGDPSPAPSEGAQPSGADAGPRAATRARTRSTTAGGNMPHKPDAGQRKPSRTELSPPRAKETRKSKEHSTSERKADEALSKKPKLTSPAVSRDRRPSATWDTAEPTLVDRERRPSVADSRDRRRPSVAEARDTRPSVTESRERRPSVAEPRERRPSISESTERRPSVADPRERRPSVAEPRERRPSVAETRERRLSVAEPRERRPSVTESRERRPSVAEPRERWPSVVEPREMRPSVAEPRERRPSVTESRERRPSVAEPRERRPSVTETRERRPSVAEPRERRPSVTESRERRPSVAEPRERRPSVTESRDRLLSTERSDADTGLTDRQSPVKSVEHRRKSIASQSPPAHRPAPRSPAERHSYADKITHPIDVFPEPDKSWYNKVTSPTVPFAIDSAAPRLSDDQYLADDYSDKNSIAKIQANLNENIMIKSPRTPMDARTNNTLDMVVMDLEQHLGRTMRKRPPVDPSNKFSTQDASHQQGVEISKSAKIPSVNPYQNRMSIFSPQPKENEILELMAVDDGFNHEDMMKQQFPPGYPESLFFKEDSKDQGVQETLNLVDRLRMQLSTKKVTTDSGADDAVMSDEKECTDQDLDMHPSNIEHPTPITPINVGTQRKDAIIDLVDRSPGKHYYESTNASSTPPVDVGSRELTSNSQSTSSGGDKWGEGGTVTPAPHARPPSAAPSDRHTCSDDSRSLSVADHDEPQHGAAAAAAAYDNNSLLLGECHRAPSPLPHPPAAWGESKITQRRSSASSTDSEASACERPELAPTSGAPAPPADDPYRQLARYQCPLEPLPPLNQYGTYPPDASPFISSLTLPMYPPATPLLYPPYAPLKTDFCAAFTSSSQNLALTAAMVAATPRAYRTSPAPDLDLHYEPLTLAPVPPPAPAPGPPPAPHRAASPDPPPPAPEPEPVPAAAPSPAPATAPSPAPATAPPSAPAVPPATPLLQQLESKSPHKPRGKIGKSPGKSPGFSPKQNETKPKKASNRGRGGGRGRGRGKSRGAAHYNTGYVSKLVGTVYDFDDELTNDGLDLKTLRDRRKSVDVRDSPRSPPPAPRSPSPAQPPPAPPPAPPSPPSTPSPPSRAAAVASPPSSPVVAPLLPGPVDMRTYQAAAAAAAAAPPAAPQITHLLERFAAGTADHHDTDIDEEQEKQLHTDLSLMQHGLSVAPSVPPPVSPPAPAPAPRPQPPAQPPQQPYIPPLPKVSLSDSRNQLKVKIKGPFLDANYSSSITPAVPAAPAPSGAGWRKKELLRQYWTQDMNMDEPPPAPAAPPPPGRAVFTIPKAVASMTSIPTREDYRAGDSALDKKKRKTAALMRELRQLDPGAGALLGAGVGGAGAGVAAAGAGAVAAAGAGGKRRPRASAKPSRSATLPAPPKLTIRINAGVVQSVTSEEPSSGHQFRPPKKRFQMPSFEDMRRESMKYRRQVMADFEDDEPLAEDKMDKVKKHKPTKSEKRKKKKNKKAEKLQIVNSESDSATKLIIKIKRPKEDAAAAAVGGPGLDEAPVADVFDYDPVAPDPLALDPPSYGEASSARRRKNNKIRSAKVTPIRLKLARSAEGYVMSGAGEAPAAPAPARASSPAGAQALSLTINKHCEVR